MSTEAPARPAVATISGVEVVTIPLAHYAELLDCQRQVRTGVIAPQRFTADLRCRIDRDPEVAAFLTECFGRMLLKEAVAAAAGRPPTTFRACQAGTEAKLRSRVCQRASESRSFWRRGVKCDSVGSSV